MALKVYVAIHSVDNISAPRDELINGSVAAGTVYSGGALKQRNPVVNKEPMDFGETKNTIVLKYVTTAPLHLLESYGADDTWSNWNFLAVRKSTVTPLQGLVWVEKRIYCIDQSTSPDTFSYFDEGTATTIFPSLVPLYQFAATDGRKAPAFNGRDFINAAWTSGIAPFGEDVYPFRPDSALDEYASIYTSPVSPPLGGSTVNGITWDGRNWVILFARNGTWIGAPYYYSLAFTPPYFTGSVRNYDRAQGAAWDGPGTFQYSFDIDFDWVGKNFLVFYVTDV